MAENVQFLEMAEDVRSRRYQQLIQTLTEAKKNIEDWQNQKTDALITLDSFSYDLRQLELEKQQIKEEYEECLKVSQAREREWSEKLIQMNLQMEEWRARAEEQEQRANNYKAEKEHFEAKAEEEKNKAIETRAQCDAEKAAHAKRLDQRIEEARRIDREQIDLLSHERMVLAGEKERAEIRSRRAEQELQAFRAQLLGLMKQSEEGQLSSSEGVRMPQAPDPKIAVTSNTKPEVVAVEEVSTPEIQLSANTETHKPVQATVYEYLKRLGY